MPIYVKRRDGTVTPFRNAHFMPLFYFLPKSVLARCGKELNNIPRNPMQVRFNYDAIALVESDLFLELIMDAYAYMVWPYMGFGEYMEIYSGYDPAWIFAHSAGYWGQELQDSGVLPTPGELFQTNANLGWVPEELVSLILKKIVPQAMARYKMGGAIAIVKDFRCFEDYDARASNQKTDFYRKWYHTQTKHPQISLESFQEEYAEQHGGQEWDVEDEAANFENDSTVKVLAEQFMETLSEKDRQLLRLRLEGYTLEETADKLGYANHTGVLKRLKKIGQAFEKYADVDYGFDGKRIL